MIISFDKESSFYTKKGKILNSCITINNNDVKHYYEFNIDNYSAIVRCSDLEFIEEAVELFYHKNKYITKYRIEDNSFYKEYDYVYTFKLPINIIQPSTFYLKESRINEFDNLIDDELITIPVTIINDEYVALDGHHRLKYLLENDYKMVNVYLDDADDIVNDYVYIAKEQNIRSIKSLELLSDEEYNSFLESLENMF